MAKNESFFNRPENREQTRAEIMANINAALRGPITREVRIVTKPSDGGGRIYSGLPSLTENGVVIDTDPILGHKGKNRFEIPLELIRAIIIIP